LGRSGITSFKREGDGATPRGKVAVELSKKYGAWVKPDSAFRRIAPRSVFQTLTKSDGWCDDSGHPSYNKYVQRPFPGSHEALLREDSLYDLIITLGWNTSPVIRHKGSAIFWHIAPSTERKSGKFGTEGCVSLEPKHFRQILEQMKVRGTPTHMRIL
jgi:L,D-peptidoglycan transpeptidase YkuD (ErfK/YbiS/YcfS/YnhG family)